ncbi:hypothetical protein GCM10010250_23520 [Streptomyces althioticus]|nr:hypothetical protein GCM10010250_23520 [Streptomyces althioticus]GGT63491.1 hypothetical protein GCM10010243_48060 [Streptomyces matensis]
MPRRRRAGTHTEMSDALVRVMDALVGASEDEVAAALAAVGASSLRQSAQQSGPCTPLPCPGGASTIHSEVEWV